MLNVTPTRVLGGYKCAIGILASCYSRPLHKVARVYIYRPPNWKYEFLRKLVVAELTKQPHIFTHCNPQVQYCSQKEPAPTYTLSQLNPALSLSLSLWNFLNIFYVTLLSAAASSNRPRLLMFRDYSFLKNDCTDVSHTVYMYCPHHKWRAQIWGGDAGLQPRK